MSPKARKSKKWWSNTEKKDMNGKSTKWKKNLGCDNTEERFPDGKDTDIVILVMGPTGVGKSQFIRDYTGIEDVQVGHKLTSCTRDVSWYISRIPENPEFNGIRDRRLILVDTPGFDDTYVDDSEILRRVAAWLAKSYNEEKTLAGIIYINAITSMRMLGSTRKNFELFQRLCGDSSFCKVVLATSKWDELPELTPSQTESPIGVKREQELRDSFWKGVLDGGAAMKRINEKPADQKAIIEYIINTNLCNERNQRNTVLQIQQEIVDLEKLLPSTKAGRELKYSLQGLLKAHESALKNTADDKVRADVEEKRLAVEEQLKAMKLSLSDRLKKLCGFRG